VYLLQCREMTMTIFMKFLVNYNIMTKSNNNNNNNNKINDIVISILKYILTVKSFCII